MKTVKKSDKITAAILMAVLIILVFILDRTLPATSIAMMVLKKFLLDL